MKYLTLLIALLSTTAAFSLTVPITEVKLIAPVEEWVHTSSRPVDEQIKHYGEYRTGTGSEELIGFTACYGAPSQSPPWSFGYWGLFQTNAWYVLAWETSPGNSSVFVTWTKTSAEGVYAGKDGWTPNSGGPEYARFWGYVYYNLPQIPS